MKAYVKKTEDGFTIEFEHGEKYLILTETLIQIAVDKDVADFIECPDDFYDYDEDEEYKKIIITKNVKLFAKHARKWNECAFHEKVDDSLMSEIFDYTDWKSLNPIKIKNKKTVSKLWDECEITVITRDCSNEKLREPSLADLIGDMLYGD